MNWTYLLLSYLSLIGLGLADNLRGPVYPELLSQYGLSNSQGSLFFSLTAVFAVTNNMATSWWLNKWGVMNALRIYTALLFIALVTIGLASQAIVVWIGVSIMGLSFGGLGVCQNLLVVHGSTPERRTQALGGLHTMYGLASLAAPILVTVSYLVGWKWNSVFLIGSIVPITILIWSFKEKSNPTFATSKDELSDNKLSYRALFWVAAFTSLYVMSEILVSSRLVLYVREFEGYSPKQANDLLSAFFITLIIGRLALSVVQSPFESVNLLRGSLALAMVTLLLAIFVHPLWFVAVDLAMSLSFPCMLAYASEYFGIHTPRAMAWIFTGHYMGLMTMHAAVGVITDQWGLRPALLFGPLFLASSFVLLLLKPQLSLGNKATLPR